MKKSLLAIAFSMALFGGQLFDTAMAEIAIPLGATDTDTATSYGAIADGTGATAAGNDSIADAYSTTAVGDGAEASGDNSTAVGENSVGDGEDATAVGNGSAAYVTNATAIGTGASVTSENSVAIGSGSTADTAPTTTSSMTVDGTSYATAGGVPQSDLIREAVDLVIQIARDKTHPAGRRITAMLDVKSMEELECRT